MSERAVFLKGDKMSFLERLRDLTKQEKSKISETKREEREALEAGKWAEEKEQKRRRVKYRELRKIYLDLIKPTARLARREYLGKLNIKSDLYVDFPTEKEACGIGGGLGFSISLVWGKREEGLKREGYHLKMKLREKSPARFKPREDVLTVIGGDNWSTHGEGDKEAVHIDITDEDYEEKFQDAVFSKLSTNGCYWCQYETEQDYSDCFP